MTTARWGTGTLKWMNGEASTKTISIPISKTAPFGGSKTFAIALSGVWEVPN